jgi:hypothetical protein
MIMCLKSLQLMEKGMVLHKGNWKFFFLICMFITNQSFYVFFLNLHIIFGFSKYGSHHNFHTFNFQWKIHQCQNQWFVINLAFIYDIIYIQVFFILLSLFPKKPDLSLNSHYNVLYMWTFQPRPPWYVKINNNVIWSLGSL